jgi:uroporphyrinogen decarboxylase
VGIENLMIWMLSEPGFVHDLLDQITDYNISLIHHAVDIGGVDGVRLGDDWAGQQGLLFGEELWLEFVKPRMIRICEAARKKNLYIGQHCCGKVDELLPHLVDLGIHVFDPFQPEVTDIFSIYRKYCGKIVFMGGLSIQKTMPFGTEDEVWSECVHLLNILGKNGGYIFSPSHALTPDIPVNNIETMIRAFREYSNKSLHG